MPEIGGHRASWPAVFTFAALATWRVTHLLTEEDGPANVVLGLRRAAGSSALGQAMDCFYCTSMWVALPIAAGLTSEKLAMAPGRGITRSRRAAWGWRAAAWLALSGTACLLEQATRPRAAAAPADDPDVGQAGHLARVRSLREAGARP
ncbi:MAG TPA: hypothetical protein VI365_28205 [Trebonia sp.]